MIIQTVAGKKPASEMGVTSTHEHFLWDQRCYLPQTPEELSERAFMNRKICMRDLGRIRYNMHKHIDNIVQMDVDEAIEETLEFKYAGGQTICDCSVYGLGRDPKALVKISQATGINILMGTGLYIERSHPESMRQLTRDRLADLFTAEIVHGVKDTGIQAGFIGEIGVSTFSDREREVLAAAAITQKNTGAALVIHQPGLNKQAGDILDWIARHGGDLGKVVLGHSDIFENDLPYLESSLKRGAVISFDQFGIEIALDYSIWLPRDIDRIRAIARLIERGYGKQIVLGQDVCFKASYKKYGGYGYAHLLDQISILMRRQGFTGETIRQLLVDNPMRVFAMDE
ncbi:MAG TPA: hypothetical protein DD640_01965 [Clostridiales bacterium]|nr:hypothetical protein [Clostridiales bacterium]